jgi:predicted transcriptional regulator
VTNRNTVRRPLTDLQQAILDVVWARGSATAETVREALAPAHRLKDSSVRTLLRRLEARGFLRHRVDGKVYRYEAAVPRTRVAARAVQQIIDRFWGGSAEQFLAGMVDARVLSEAEIKRLADKVKSRKKA